MSGLLARVLRMRREWERMETDQPLPLFTASPTDEGGMCAVDVHDITGKLPRRLRVPESELDTLESGAGDLRQWMPGTHQNTQTQL